MPYKAKSKGADGKLVDVEIEELPEGVITREQFDTQFKDELGRRLSSAEKKALEKALEDPEFKAGALSRWGIDLAKLAASGELNKEKLDQALKDWRKSELEPVTKERDEHKTELQRLRDKELESEILEAADVVGVKAEYRKKFGERSTASIVAMFREKFGWDPESKRWCERDGKDGFAFSTSGTHRFRTVEEAFKRLAETDKEFKELLSDKRPPGPGIKRPGHTTTVAEELEKLPPAERVSRARELGLK